MLIRIPRPMWQLDGACRCQPGESDRQLRHRQQLFFPGRGESAEPAKRICADCPVVKQCAQWALADHGLEGVLGGMTAGERDRIRTRSNR